MSENTFYSFPDIQQFRNVIQDVTYRTRFIGKDENGELLFDGTIPLPVLNYRGTVKLHGTNSGLIFTSESGSYQFYCQSRENIITPLKDNMGFAAFIYTRPVLDLLKLIPSEIMADSPIVKVYSEWCGQKIQRGVGIAKLSKRMVIFGVKINNEWISDDILKNIKLPEYDIYNILDYPVYNISIDFNNPKEAADKMALLVDEIDKECPVAKAFGVEGPGEGLVWVPCDKEWLNGRFFFKTKGDSHKISETKVKVPVNTEKVNSISEFVNNTVTENRLNQGLDKLRENNLELDIKNIAFFLKWVYGDIVKEELDTMMANNIEPKEVGGYISNKARPWFMSRLNEKAGI